MKKLKLRNILMILVLVSGILVFAACDGANSASWTMVVNHSEQSLNDGFRISVGSARSGRRNRTFNLSAEELAAMHINSSSDQGEIILVISQNGTEDGTEVTKDISNFSGGVDTSTLNPGRIRLSFHFDNVRNSNTTVSWR